MLRNVTSFNIKKNHTFDYFFSKLNMSVYNIHTLSSSIQLIELDSIDIFDINIIREIYASLNFLNNKIKLINKRN